MSFPRVSALVRRVAPLAISTLERFVAAAYFRQGPPLGFQMEYASAPGALSLHERQAGAASSAENSSLGGLLSGIWFAVPKRKVRFSLRDSTTWRQVTSAPPLRSVAVIR